MDARLVASRLPISMYGIQQPFNAPPFPAGYLPPYGPPADASAFYPPLGAGENADAWRAGLSQAAAAAYYDPGFAAHYGYGYGPMALADGARRKNATRETTSTLKAWLNEHRKNPYPTKGEKIMLAIITKMTLTQVSTWFANARRRLKKENKMTWSPRNRCGEDDDDDIMDGEDENNNLTDNRNNDRSGSRCSTPNRIEKTSNESHRMSNFDLPHQATRHPFIPRPEITGSFTIQGPGNGTVLLPTGHENASRRSNKEDEEEIDLESVDEEQKEHAFGKRKQSSDFHSEDNTQRRGTLSPKVTSKASSHPSFHPTNSSSSRSHSHGLPASNPTFGHNRVARQDSISPRSHPYSRNLTSSPTSSSISSASSPSKPKIWSLADVATSNNDSAKQSKSDEITSVNTSISSTSPTPAMASIFGNRAPMQGLPPPHHHQPLNPEAQATIRHWMDGMMQQKMVAAAAAVMSGGQGPSPAFFPGGFLPQHLAAALNPATLAMAASLPRAPEGARLPHPFPGFAELAAVQRAHMNASHVADLQAQAANAMHATSPIPLTGAHKPIMDSLAQSRPIISREEKIRSPTSLASSPRSEMAEMSAFTALNNRPASGDSGIASAETTKEAQPSESNAAK